MSLHNKRIQTIKTILAGSVVARSGNYSRITTESNDVENVTKVAHKPRRLLLQVLHSTRALDTTLKSFVVQRGIGTNPPFSIGASLRLLATHRAPGVGSLASNEGRRYQNSIANIRNRYMHEAGAYPATDNDLLSLLADMESCLARVMTL